MAVALMLGVVVWPASDGYQFLARAAICGISLTAALQAGRTDRNAWVLGLIAIAVLFNPFVPVVLPRPYLFVVLATCLTGLAAWLVVLEQSVPAQSVAQILHPPDVVK